MRNRDILSIYASGLCELALGALGFAIIILMAMQMMALAGGFHIDAGGVLLFAWQTIVFLALWPGQTFWTIRRITPEGFEHSVIGIPSDDDMRVTNHRVAQQMRHNK
jgi:hypothetical protein